MSDQVEGLEVSIEEASVEVAKRHGVPECAAISLSASTEEEDRSVVGFFRYPKRRDVAKAFNLTSQQKIYEAGEHLWRTCWLEGDEVLAPFTPDKKPVQYDHVDGFTQSLLNGLYPKLIETLIRVAREDLEAF